MPDRAPEDRPVEDRFAEALRRWRHGQIRPLWADASEGLKAQWLREGAVLLRLMKGLDITLAATAGPQLSARALAVTRRGDIPRAAVVLFDSAPTDGDLRLLLDLLTGRENQP